MDNYPPSVNELVESHSNSGIPRPLLVDEVRKAIDEGEWNNLDAVSYTHLRAHET